MAFCEKGDVPPRPAPERFDRLAVVREASEPMAKRPRRQADGKIFGRQELDAALTVIRRRPLQSEER